MTSALINDLEQQFNQLQTRDRARVAHKLSLAKSRLAKGQPVDKLISTAAGWVEASIAKVAARDAVCPAINYPDLPVSDRRDEIKKAISENQVVVVAGETGSGKTTQLPKICLELGLGRKGLIGHTQPRRLAARSVANRIASELNVELGQQVGFQIRFTDQVTDQSLVKLMTDGILLAETQNDPNLEKYEVIIIDEAHERSLNIDFLLGYLKRILPRRPDLKVIITSATIDLERFSQHFNNAPVIQVSGRTYPVEVCYRPLSEQDEDTDLLAGVVSALDEIEAIDSQKPTASARDVLVFLPGERDIREIGDGIRHRMDKGQVEVLPLYARLSNAEQNKIFSSQRTAKRRVILATNVAETSLTVPGIGYVIDPGTARISRYSYRSKVQRLPIEAISQASANQRKGRCGRISEGVCFRLYSEEDFVGRPEFTDPEIRRTNLASVILQMLSLKLGNISDFPFIDAPDTRFVNDGYKLLEELGAVNSKRSVLPLGKELARLPVDPRIARMIVQANREGALNEVLIIAAALSVQDPRERPADKKQASDQAHKTYAHEQSDFLSWVNLWELYEEQRQSLSQSQLRKFAKKHYLSFMRMREWRDIHHQLLLICKQQNYALNEEPATYEQVHTSLLAGLLSQMGMKDEGKEFLGSRNRRFHIFPGSGQFKKPPKWVMAAELVETNKLYARMVAKIEPEWAERLAKGLVKRSHSEPHWEKKRAQVVANEQVTLFGLIIVAKRKVNFGRIEPETAHEIFIREGLVMGQLHTKAPFLAHNLSLLEEVEGLENKIRRKDLLVDEEQLFSFYQSKLKAKEGDKLVNGGGFENWRKSVEAEEPKYLFMTKADVLARSDAEITEAYYPTELKVSGVELPVEYAFEPGKKHDGLTLDTPLPLLTQVTQARLEWLVPGMLREKCIALLKGLPKARRKHFVPIPDVVDKMLAPITFGEGDLYEAMCYQLKRLTMVVLDPKEFADIELEPHLKMRVRVLDAKGNEIAQGEDLVELQAKYADAISESLKAAPGDSWGQEGITRWDFGELPEQVEVKQAGGIFVTAYPCIEDKGDQVALTVVSHQDLAHQKTRQGVVRLALLNLRETAKFARKQLTHGDKSAILLGQMMPTRALQDQCVAQAADQLMDLSQGLPKSQGDFEARLLAAKQELTDKVAELNTFVLQCATLYHQIQKQLKGKIQLADAPILNDVKHQLGQLFDGEFIAKTRWERLQHFPRYLKAITLRLEKFRRNLNQERFHSEQLQNYWSEYASKRASYEKQGNFDQRLEDYRWLLEEYRVSLFAQQLGTQTTVSEKRLKQFWRDIP